MRPLTLFLVAFYTVDLAISCNHGDRKRNMNSRKRSIPVTHSNLETGVAPNAVETSWRSLQSNNVDGACGPGHGPCAAGVCCSAEVSDQYLSNGYMSKNIGMVWLWR
jgi:hypothetical protein